jgi:hypothetical protein
MHTQGEENQDLSYQEDAPMWINAGYRVIPVHAQNRNTLGGYTGKGAIPPTPEKSLSWVPYYGDDWGMGVVLTHEPGDMLFLVVIDLDTQAGVDWLKVAEASHLGKLPFANMVVSSGNHGDPTNFHHRYFLSRTPVRGHGLAGVDIKSSWGFVNAGSTPKPGANPWINYTDTTCTSLLSTPTPVCLLPVLSPEWAEFLDKSKDQSARGTMNKTLRPWSPEDSQDPINKFNVEDKMTWEEILGDSFVETEPGKYEHPNATNPKSAEIYEDDDCERLCVWSPNTDLEQGVYRKIDALAALKFDNKYGEACAWVRQKFYQPRRMKIAGFNREDGMDREW